MKVAKRSDSISSYMVKKRNLAGCLTGQLSCASGYPIIYITGEPSCVTGDWLSNAPVRNTRYNKIIRLYRLRLVS